MPGSVHVPVTAFFPMPSTTADAMKNMSKGNFGLRFNKYAPIVITEDTNKRWKACDGNGNTAEAVTYYSRQANVTYGNNDILKEGILKKHLAQKQYCDFMKGKGYDAIIFHAKLTSRFITGIGQSHPNEIGMCFDHTLGIPYISASSLKGAVRFANAATLFNSVFAGKNSFNDEEDALTRSMFGGIASKGEAVFLDAYPLYVPKMVTEIINPHYGNYFDPNDKKDYPDDHHNPVPVKFLAVESGIEFVFRCVFEKNEEIRKRAEQVFLEAFKNGLGAKTSIGFGRFDRKMGEPEIIETESNRLEEEKQRAQKQKDEEKDKLRLQMLTPDERKIEEIKKLIKDRSIIGDFVKKTLEGQFSKEVFTYLKEKLDELGEWKPETGTSYQKMKERQEKIQARIDGGS